MHYYHSGINLESPLSAAMHTVQMRWTHYLLHARRAFMSHNTPSASGMRSLGEMIYTVLLILLRDFHWLLE